MASLLVYVKSYPGQPDRLGDCPFSHRVLLTLEELGVSYERQHVDTSLPRSEWFLKLNPSGKVPVVKFSDADVLPDSDAIVERLVKDYPGVPLTPPDEFKGVGSTFFGAFRNFLISKDAADDTKAKLVEELGSLEKHLQNHSFLGGDKVTLLDTSFVPKLYHAIVALKHFKGYDIAVEFPAVAQYFERFKARPSFERTNYGPDAIIAGWERALAS